MPILDTVRKTDIVAVLSKFAWTCLTSFPLPQTDVDHFLHWNWWNSRISARGCMMLVSFVCQQACLFCLEGVRFWGLLNQTGRFVSGCQPDAHIQEEGLKGDLKENAGQMERRERCRCFVISCASALLIGSCGGPTPWQMYRDLSLLLSSPSKPENNVVQESESFLLHIFSSTVACLTGA